MDLSPYLDSLRRDLTATAAPGGEETARVADLLATALDASARLCLIEVLADATAEITTKLDGATVEVRLRGREADLVVTTTATPAETPEAAPAAPVVESGDLTRLTLRLPEGLKEGVERAAAAEGISVNAWLVRATANALRGPMPAPPTTHHGRRITGFAQA
ncbi:toxin-antitoxin system HicB family antitoxin [Catellatospora tritici]|uniref:toxin-antitoxin system HicB family antitoxin n=1 Tax=Catellatospora tritici TaxID=2851566 RepID=UPI001C2CD772|nr:toxin-antitoxin system HicB family antitoxin [Catellatospora tritici]MBV1848568.1 toxin-antitoxin system HicB family antitoxin [Catellatospora tritici]MBV1851412.1 toxin-antitoxin system HicB family antitoxin [Catellatospora tritici]